MSPNDTKTQPKPKPASSGIKDLVDKLRANPKLVSLLMQTIDQQKEQEKKGG
jgi:hypothetical protein